jgi:hypothetical protein
MKTPRPKPRVYWSKIGPGPWTCHKCGELVEKIGHARMDGNVHHLDEDPFNNELQNIVMMHVVCHQREHPPTEEQKIAISEKLKGRPSPTKGMRFPAEVNAKKAMPGESNPFYGKTHTEETRAKMRKPKRRVTCEHCGGDYAANWLERHRREGKCIPRRVIVINGVRRVRGVEEKTLCPDCDKPYAARWMARHKGDGLCIKL